MELALMLQLCIYTCTYFEAHRASSDITALYTCAYTEAKRASSDILKPRELSSDITTLYTCFNIGACRASSDVTALHKEAYMQSYL